MVALLSGTRKAVPLGVVEPRRAVVRWPSENAGPLF